MELKTYPILSVQCFRRCSATPDQEGFPSKTQCLGAEVVDYNFDIVIIVLLALLMYCIRTMFIAYCMNSYKRYCISLYCVVFEL